MGKLRRRRRALQHGPKEHTTDVAAIAIGAGGAGVGVAVAAGDAGQVAGTEAATTVVDAEADGRSSCWFLVGSF